MATVWLDDSTKRKPADLSIELNRFGGVVKRLGGRVEHKKNPAYSGVKVGGWCVELGCSHV